MASNHFAPAPMPVLLSNGFYWGFDGRILDKNRREVIAPKVRYIMWHDEWVYGYRRGPAGESYYFICKPDQDCSDSQSYNDLEFVALLESKGIPAFDEDKMKSYDRLLDEQVEKGINTGYGG